MRHQVVPEAVRDSWIASGAAVVSPEGIKLSADQVDRIKVDDGTWYVTTLTQSEDAMLRGMGMTPIHFKSEKANPLDSLKEGDKVLFRLQERKYLNGSRLHMHIPFADNPGKEVEFITRFVPNVPQPPPQSQKPTDNVKAMCDSGKLAPELQTQYCGAAK